MTRRNAGVSQLNEFPLYIGSLINLLRDDDARCADASAAKRQAEKFVF